MDKLPDRDFGGRVSAARDAVAATAAAGAAAEPEARLRGTTRQENDDANDVDVLEGSSLPSGSPGKLSNVGRSTSSASGRLKRGLSRLAEEISNGVDGAEDGDDGSEADRDVDNSCGGGGESMRPAFVWVVSHEGDAGPHTAVLARNAEWAVVARDVRFRLANAWLSCEQVCNEIKGTQPPNTDVCRRSGDVVSFPRSCTSVLCRLFHVFVMLLPHKVAGIPWLCLMDVLYKW